MRPLLSIVIIALEIRILNLKRLYSKLQNTEVVEMSLVKHIEDDDQFTNELQRAENRLVVVDFTATWCGPCRKIAPFFDQMSIKYTNVVFLKVDVDKCGNVALNNNVKSMPTFIFYQNRARVHVVSGANNKALEDGILKYSTTSSESDNSGGFIDLNRFILKSGTECLNESDEHPLKKCLFDEPGYLESDCDEQLIISIEFTQPMKIHSLKIKAPEDKGPKSVRLFINLPRTLDFDQAESIASVQDIEFSKEDVNGPPVELRFVKFQNVQNLQIFVKSNQEDADTTVIESLVIYGLPINATNMNEFKRISGKKGESH